MAAGSVSKGARCHCLSGHADAPAGDRRRRNLHLNGKPVPTFTIIRKTSPGVPPASPASTCQPELPRIELTGPESSELLAIAAAVEGLLPKLPAPTVRD
jgi:hypothetical protein